MTNLIRDMPAQKYHTDMDDKPWLSSSIAHTLINRSPLHAHNEHPRLGNNADEGSAAADFGTLCHDLMLGGKNQFEICKVKAWNETGAKKIKEDALAAGKIPIKVADYERAIAAVTAWRRLIPEEVLNQDFGDCEASFKWTEPNGVVCCCRFDQIFNESIWDLKTTSDSSPDKCLRKVVNEGLDLRSEFYKRGAGILYPDYLGRFKFGFVFAETKPPFAVTIFGTHGELDGKFQFIGAKKVEKAIQVWGECLASGKWPGYSTPNPMECPHWKLMQEITEGEDDESN